MRLIPGIFFDPICFQLNTGRGGGEAVASRAEIDIARVVSAILVAPDPKSCARLFSSAIAKFKIDTFACGEVDLADRERAVFYAIAWPDAWRDFYIGSGMVNRDPVLDALRRYDAPFSWSDLKRDRKMSAAGSEALQLCADNGWTEGLVVPIPHGDQRFGLVSVACQRSPFGTEEKSLLSMLSHCFHGRLRNLAPQHGFAMPPMGLTRREIDTLRLIARGATDREVGLELGIAASTAHEYFETAKRKLRVSTRAEAVAIAVSLAIVSP